MKQKTIIARYKSHGKKFEILLDWQRYQEYKKGKPIAIDEIVVGEGVFSDIRKAERAKEADIKAVFDDKPIEEIYKIIIEKGEVQLTEEQKRELIDEKRRRIINFIATHAIDAQTSLPIPPTRIEHALEQIRFRVDPLDSVEKQIERAIKELRPLLPIRIETKTFLIRCDLGVAGRLRAELLKIGTIKSEDWSHSYWTCQIEIPAGLMDSLIGVVNKITHQEGYIEEIKRRN